MQWVWNSIGGSKTFLFKIQCMDKKENSQAPQTSQNPTLHEKGTRVPDYGNVMGGSGNADAGPAQEKENKDRSGNGENETQGNP